MDKTQKKPTLTKKRSLEWHEERDSKKERKRLKLEKTEPKTELQSEEIQLKKIMEFKNQGQKLTEKEKLKKIFLKNLQKLGRSGDEPKSEVMMTIKKKEQKVKTESPAAPVAKDEISKTGESSLKSQEVGKKTGENKKKMS